MGNAFNYFLFKHKESNLLSTNNLISFFFILGLILIFFNFFIPLSNSLLILFILIYALFSVLFSKNILLNFIKRNIVALIIVSIITFYMKAGYDGGLYHLPHQAMIRDSKIIFGLFNLHERFGLISIYGYISSVFWIKNNLLILSYLQGTFYLFLFIFCKELIFSKEISKKIIGFSSLIFVPIWIRYVDPSYALVDIPAAIIFVYSFVKGIELINSQHISKFELKIFLISASLLFTLKTSYIVFVLYVIFIYLNLLQNKKIKISESFNYLFLPCLLVIFWVIKSFINTSCFFYPSTIGCFETPWSDIALTKVILNEIITFGKTYTSFLNLNIVLKFIPVSFYYIIIILLLFLFILKKFIKIKNIQPLLKVSLFSLFTICFVFYLFLDPIIGYSQLINQASRDNNIIVINLFLKEIIILLVGLFLSILISFLFIFKEIKFFKRKNDIKNLLVLMFCISFNLYWLLMSPNPRFAMGFFAIIPASLAIVFLNFIKINLKKNSENYLNLIFIIILILSNFILVHNKFKINNINDFPKKVISDIKSEKRDGFGIKPLVKCNNLFESNFCWLEKNCYFIEKDARIEYLILGYKLINRIEDRKTIQCK